MTHALSRRIARAISALDLTSDERYRLAVEAQPYDNFHDLPIWIQQLVRQGEGTS
jgi:hypothetical protein